MKNTDKTIVKVKPLDYVPTVEEMEETFVIDASVDEVLSMMRGVVLVEEDAVEK